MPRAAVRWSTGGVAAVSAVLLVAGIALSYADRHMGPLSRWDFSDVFEEAAFIAVPVVGFILVSRRPGNRVGWIFLGTGLVLGLGFAATGTGGAGWSRRRGRCRGSGGRVVRELGPDDEGYGYSSLMVRKDLVDSGRYKTVADLKGMKVAIGAPGTGTASALNETLKTGGLKYNDVEVVYLGFPEHLPAFLNKGIDAAISNEPTMTLEIEQGAAVRIIGNDVTYPDQQTAVVFYSERFIKSRHDVAERLCAPISAASASITTP